MTFQSAIILGLVISLMIIGFVLGYFQHLWFAGKRIPKQILEHLKAKRRSKIVYPKELKTDEQITSYLRKNYRHIPEKKEWHPMLLAMIRELTEAGWNSEMPIYFKWKYGRYEIEVITNDEILYKKLSEIKIKYQEIFDKKLMRGN